MQTAGSRWSLPADLFFCNAHQTVLRLHSVPSVKQYLIGADARVSATFLSSLGFSIDRNVCAGRCSRLVGVHSAIRFWLPHHKYLKNICTKSIDDAYAQLGFAS